jgi:signal transduction histidine kinase
MRDVTTWKRGPQASRCAAIQLPAGQGVLGAVLHHVTAERAHPGLPAGAHGIELSIDIEGAPIQGLEGERATEILFIGSTTEPHSGPALLASEPCFPRMPFAEDGVCIVDAETRGFSETVPFFGQKTGRRINGEILHDTYSPERTGMIDSGIRYDTSYALRQARLQVEEAATANRRKDEFLAMLGHELRNPLASINHGIHLLSRQMQDTSARQKTQAMLQRQVRRMTQLVHDLLDVSRITHGRLHLQPERIDLREVVSNAIETLGPDINERHHRLTTALPDAPVWLQGDAGRLEQVFVNLLANASRYTNAGGELAVWMHTREGQAIVRVRDSGIGIAPEVLPQLFDLFRQANQAAPHSHSGLGIGLALVRNLVESHGGSVTGASAGLGQGSEFTVRLPREA